MKRRILLIAALTSSPVSVTLADESAVAYPSRKVRLLLAAAAGGNPDVLARLLGDKLSQMLGQPFFVDNMPGAAGVVATAVLVQAAPDGYTLGAMDSGPLAIAPALNSKIAYQTLKDLTFITALAAVPTILVVNSSVPANTLQEFIKLAKSRPGELNFGSAGNGSIHHLTMEMFMQDAGIKLMHIPYKGGAAIIPGLLSGEIQAGFAGIPLVRELVKSGRLRALGISIPSRSGSMPDVLTLAEQGIAKFDVASVIGLQGPAGLPRAIVAKLQGVIAKALRTNDLAEKIESLGMVVVENGTAPYEQRVKNEVERYAATVKALGLTVQ